MVTESDRLRGLQMCEARHNGGRMRLSLLHQRHLESGKFTVERVERVAHPELKVGRNLIVTGACGMKPASRFADQRTQAPLDIHVNVFKRAVERECSLAQFHQDLREPVFDGRCIGLADNTLRGEHSLMCDGARDILICETLVHIDGNVDLVHDCAGAGFKSAAPQRIAAALPGGL